MDNFLFKPLKDWSVYIYDIETYPNVFTFTAWHAVTLQKYVYEFSNRRNDIPGMIKFLHWLKKNNCSMVGFNNLAFDYPVIHTILKSEGVISVEQIYQKAMSIINSPYNDRFAHIIWQPEILQIDLLKIHHFDNVSKATSLKMLEINMGMDNVEDLPFPPDTELNNEQIDTLIEYNDYDVKATWWFYNHTTPMIEFREELTAKYGRDFTNHNDTKIGKDYFIMKLEEAVPGICYDKSANKRKVRQTPRSFINLGEVIFNYIQFDQPGFNWIKNIFKSKTIYNTKGVFEDVSCNVNGLDFIFGVGGIHASIDPGIVYSDDEYTIIDIDVASYYPNLAIANKLYPEHLSELFCTIYKDIYEQRKGYAKGTPENAMLKLALNGVYGDSNNKYSPFYDPKYTMAITINGQLLMCMLAEWLMSISHLEMIQANTDGVTVKLPRGSVNNLKEVCSGWEAITGLTLEYAEYSRMFIRDVNNYIAEYIDGSLKRKGAYAYIPDKELDWHQNHSMKIVAKAAEAALVRGEDIEGFIRNHTHIQDFLINTQVPKGSKLALKKGQDEYENLGRIVRYIVGYDGKPLIKIMPAAGLEGAFKRANKLTDEYFNNIVVVQGPFVWDERIHTKNQSIYETRYSWINTGHGVIVCNDIQDINHVDIDYKFYINRAKKLVEPLRG